MAKRYDKFIAVLPRVFIGFIAAGSAAVVPRLVAQLTLQDAGSLTLFSSNFVIIACVFALFIGIIVAIMEYGAQRSPRDTFMTALGIPALLAGALTTSDGASKISTQQAEIKALARQVSELAGIPRNETVLEFSPTGQGASTTRPPSSGALESVLGIATAHAADGNIAASPQQSFGYAVREPYYMVVLHKVTSQAEAETRAAALRRSNVDARVMHAGSNFYVTLGGPRPEQDAVQEAIRIKGRQLPGVSVTLVRTSSK